MERIPNIGTLDAELASWERHLGAGHLSEKTIAGYTYGVRQFERFLEAHGLPTQIRDIERAHVEEFISDVLQRSKPWTAQTRYRDLQQFFRYLVDTGEIDVSPVAQMRKPKLTEEPVPIVPEDDLGAVQGMWGTLIRGPTRYGHPVRVR